MTGASGAVLFQVAVGVGRFVGRTTGVGLTLAGVPACCPADAVGAVVTGAAEEAAVGAGAAATPQPEVAKAPSTIVATKTATAAPMSWPEVQDWLEDLTGLCGARLLRLKGILRVTDCPEPILVQAVGNLFSVPRRMRLAAEPVEGLVIITRDLPLAALRASSLGRQATFSDGHARRIADRAGNGSAPLSASTRLLASAACF